MFDKISLNKKMILWATSNAVILLIVGIINFFAIISIRDKSEAITDSTIPKFNNVSNILYKFKDIRIFMNILDDDIEKIESTKKYQGDAKKLIEDCDKLYKTFENFNLTDEEKHLIDNSQQHWEALKLSLGKLFNYEFSDKADDRQDFYNIITSQFRAPANIYQAEFLKLFEFYNNESQIKTKELHMISKINNMISVIAVILGCIFSILIGLIFTKKLSSNLNSVATKLDSSFEQVRTTARKTSSLSSSLSDNTTKQASALQETVASLDEINAMVLKNAENSTKSQEIASKSNTVAIKGKDVITEMMRSIDEIATSNNDIMLQIDASNKEISEIVKLIHEIGNKTKIINDIVFQTKLLSFNASVEAARAGEHGKGFAVVAEEVGNLAQMSGNAAKEISEMLESSIQNVDKIVNNTKTKVEKLIQKGKQKVESGMITAKRSEEVLDEILKGISDVNRTINEITQASQEQSIGIQEITKAINLLDQSTQQNSTTAKESSLSSNELTEQAELLGSLVKKLILIVEGADSENQPKTFSNVAQKPLVKEKTFAATRHFETTPLKNQHCQSKSMSLPLSCHLLSQKKM
ncbi:MAG: methyl-accepting chemotaxis protein [Silvanigrellaceae bacterium]|nr:methyl-accepting chemotaxis protein [Silvanigrellaceae bacterium]